VAGGAPAQPAAAKRGSGRGGDLEAGSGSSVYRAERG
jgi:hypothetical protein